MRTILTAALTGWLLCAQPLAAHADPVETDPDLAARDADYAAGRDALKARDWRLLWLKSDPFMEPLRNDQRFKSLVRRMNLPE